MRFHSFAGPGPAYRSFFFLKLSSSLRGYLLFYHIQRNSLETFLLLSLRFIYFSFSSQSVCPCPPSSCVGRSPPLSVLPSFSPPPSFTASKSSEKSECGTKRGVSDFFLQHVGARPVHVHGHLHHFGQRRPLCRGCHQRILSRGRKVSSFIICACTETDEGGKGPLPCHDGVHSRFSSAACNTKSITLTV